MFKRENNAGLYLTVAFHLLLLIILLASRISYLLKEETSFILDFTKEELLEEIARREQLKEDVSKELDDIISGREAVRNVVVDATTRREALRDDRFKDPSQVYNEAKNLQEKLNAAKREAEANRGTDNIPDPVKSEQTKSETYKGPSVISYTLDGRKAMSLPIPVYKCVGGGDVNVTIIVNRRGYVVAAIVKPDQSSPDKCLQEYAIRAAKSSRFTASSTAPERQTGEIVYRFIAQ